MQNLNQYPSHRKINEQFFDSMPEEDKKYFMEYAKKDAEKEKFRQKKKMSYVPPSSFNNIRSLINMKDLIRLRQPEVKQELQIAEEMNEKHRQNLKDDDEGRYCTFFMKTGSCRYVIDVGMHCKRIHFVPVVSKTLLIEHMFRDSWNRNKNISKGYDDALLEIDEEEINLKFNEFFTDVIPELVKFGEIQHFICCSNFVPHLRGNVFIEYRSIEDSIRAQITLNERHYGGYLLRVQFSLICDWKQAICAYDAAGSCPKYSECNFLHVYKNPGNKFPLRYVKKSSRVNKQTYRKRMKFHQQQGEKKAQSYQRRERSRSKDRYRKDRKHGHGHHRNERSHHHKHSRHHRHKSRERSRDRSHDKKRDRSYDKYRRKRRRSRDKYKHKRKNSHKEKRKHYKDEKDSEDYKRKSRQKSNSSKEQSIEKEKQIKSPVVQQSLPKKKDQRLLLSSSRSRVASSSRSRSRSSSN